MAAPNRSTLPSVPAKHGDFVAFVKPFSNAVMRERLEPYMQYDAKLREVFAQEPQHPIVSDNTVNLTPVYNGHESGVTIRARNLEIESNEEKEKYIMPLRDEDRKQDGAMAIVPTLKDFQTNFNVFSEQALVDMNWSNVVVAGSAVVTALLPVPDEYRSSKKGLRKYYHEIVAPASDVDLFIYGLDADQAIEKIKGIERCVKDALLTETTTIRTKNAITIASQYPTRHVQIVLRIYKSIAEILTGFDVDCACAAYDGSQVWTSPRALTAYMTQVNTIDITRRSPSYENRLSKYSHRGFEIYWPDLDRSRIDPTIFERSFSRTVGLSRLLILERLPKKSDREAYQDQRRRERGRPSINRYPYRYSHQLHGNIKEDHEDEVAEWVEEDEISDYHTFTIPYGPKYNAKKIEKLLYTKDLLLNAEWNNEDRLDDVNLHRHPAFFGSIEDVIGDCCGFCPKPSTPEEEAVAEEEGKKFTSGVISFIKDDPGRQAIGSFNPITDADWTEMAYVGNTARLCQAIVDGDLEGVSDWLSQDDADPNTRDYTGRTPLQLAVLCSTPEVVQCLVDHGARLIARLADGQTALHLACTRGDINMVKILLERSEENEAEEEEKEEIGKKLRSASEQLDAGSPATGQEIEEDAEMIYADEDVEMKSATSASFVEIEQKEQPDDDNFPTEENGDDPDIYDIDVLAWDVACSPLHIAIAQGHVAVVKELVQTFGADVLLPVKLFHDYDKSPRAAILTLVLALTLPVKKAKDMALTLLQLGASSAQADMDQTTALHYYIGDRSEATQVLFENDEPAVRRAINHLSVRGHQFSPQVSSPLLSAIEVGDPVGVLRLLEAGAKPMIDFATFVKAIETRFDDDHSWMSSISNQNQFNQSVQQPVLLALLSEQPAIALDLLRRGADPNTLTYDGHAVVIHKHTRSFTKGQTLLDFVETKLNDLRQYNGEEMPSPPSKSFLDDENSYFQRLEVDSYRFWAIRTRLNILKRKYHQQMESYEERLKTAKARKGVHEKMGAIRALIAGYEEVRTELHERGAKTFKKLYPKIDKARMDSKFPPQKSEGPEMFKVHFGFNLPGLTSEIIEAYLKIFEAAWVGDLSTIKAFTVGLWGWGLTKDQSPLKIAVGDSHDGFSPFSLAVLRGHMDAARGILEIAQLQYQPTQPPKTRYNIGNDSDEDSQAEEVDDDDINIQSERINDTFTIDNVGEIPMEAKSNISPSEFLSWTCPVSQMVGNQATASDLVQYAIESDNKALLTALLDLGNHYASRNSSEDSGSFFTVPRSTLDFCIRLDRVHLLAELMSRTGCGVSLDNLVKLSGVEIWEKPKYYQGLTVRGQKRKEAQERANAARGIQSSPLMTDRPPILKAAFEANLDSVEWLLSDSPVRRYSEFAANNANDKRIASIAKANGGFEKVISQFLETRFNLIVHCAVLSKPSSKSLKLLQYLVNAFPKFLEVKSESGLTPLQLAFRLHRYAFACTLIDAGADQTTRDNQGHNLLHSLLELGTTYSRKSGANGVRKMMNLIDPRLRASLSTERVTEGPGALTPLAQWIYHGKQDAWEQGPTLKEILRFPEQDTHLEMLNGAGDSPLHALTHKSRLTLMQIILEHKPLLVYRENATGRTPIEIAEDNCTKLIFSDPPSVLVATHYSLQKTTIHQGPESFLRESDGKGKRKKAAAECFAALALCKEVMEKYPGKRQLVSLHEANEVAKRLAAQQVKVSRLRWNDPADKHEGDEVEEWFKSAAVSGEEGLESERGSEK